MFVDFPNFAYTHTDTQTHNVITVPFCLRVRGEGNDVYDLICYSRNIMCVIHILEIFTSFIMTHMTIIAQWIDRFHHKCSTSLLVIPHTNLGG